MTITTNAPDSGTGIGMPHRNDQQTEMKAIQELLAVMPTGPVPEDFNVDKALATCWDGFRGSGEGGVLPNLWQFIPSSCVPWRT